MVRRRANFVAHFSFAGVNDVSGLKATRFFFIGWTFVELLLLSSPRSKTSIPMLGLVIHGLV